MRTEDVEWEGNRTRSPAHPFTSALPWGLRPNSAALQGVMKATAVDTGNSLPEGSPGFALGAHRVRLSMEQSSLTSGCVPYQPLSAACLWSPRLSLPLLAV